MAQEFFVKSDNLESKVRQLLPSQGGLGAGVDLSASTQIVPIVDLTESAEGANVRQDLQTAFSFDNVTNHTITNTTANIITNTGYYKVYGYANVKTSTTGSVSVNFILNDGSSDKDFFGTFSGATTDVMSYVVPYDFTVFLGAGDLLKATVSNGCFAIGASRQIATIDGELIPLN